MEQEYNAEKWLHTATKGIRFGPDRLAVEAELREHLADKTADMARIFHIEGEEAEQEALKRMGDPEEIGKKLAKIHKPWLGYLWMASRVLRTILLIPAVIYLMCSDYHGDAVEHPARYNPPPVVEPAQAELGGYTFRIVRAQPGPFGLQVAIRGSSPRFWERVQIPDSCITVVMPNGSRLRPGMQGTSGRSLLARGDDRWGVFYYDCQLDFWGVPNRVGDWITVELEYPIGTVELSAQIGEA